MTDTTRKQLHEALLQVKAAAESSEPPAWFDRNNGICYAVNHALESAGAPLVGPLFADIAGRWPGRASFSFAFPVGGYAEYKWEQLVGTPWQNPRRWELLNWLIEQTRDA